jgi:histidinol-phosphatase
VRILCILMSAALSTRELNDLLAEARQIVGETRTVIFEALAKGFGHRLKPDRSFVTDVDFAVEERVRAILGARFPDHGVIGEELPEQDSSSDFSWVIDPIDGTRSFRHRVPLFGTLLALLHKEEPVLGVIDIPGLDKTYSAALTMGTYCNGTRIHLDDLASDDAIENEIIAIGERQQFQNAGKTAVFDELMHSHPSVRTYCDCFGHGLAIEGSTGAMVDFDLRIWDTIATKVLVEEAGGRYTCVGRRGDRIAEARFDVVLGKPRVVDWILNVVNAASG